jgi:hypothetical protein
MTISEIKRRTQETSPYFFSKDTMRFFGQTMRSFSVRKQDDGRYKISAPMRNSSGETMGETVRYFNPVNNQLENN